MSFFWALWYFVFMKNYLSDKITQKTRLGIVLILTIVNLLFRVIVPRLEPWWLLLGSELAFFMLLAAWTWAGSGFFNKKKDRPLSVVFLITILDSLILILFAAWSGRIFQSAAKGEAGLVIYLAGGFLLIVFTAILGLILSAFRELFFLKKMRQPGWFFEAMLVCFIFSFFTPAIAPIAVPFFMSLSICFMVLNSFRVKWIAFLVKKQKKMLIALAGLSLGIFLAADRSK